MNVSLPQSANQVYPQAELGGLVARLLAGSWRADSPAPDLSASELNKIAPLLCQTGSAALGWWKLDRLAVADSSRGLSAQRDTPGSERDGSDPEGVEEARTMLHQAYRKFRLAALVHEQEIKRVVSLLRAEGIEPVLVKGWAIARLYPDKGLRPYGDIDLCVRPDQFAQAERALKCLDSLDGHYVDLHAGFSKLSGPQRSRVSRVPTLVGSFLRGKRPAEAGTLNTALWAELFERSQLVDLGEDKIRVLCEEDHLRLLCLHLLRSGAWRPLWLCDVAVALETRAANFDWDRCLGTDRKIAAWVRGTIGLAQRLLGAEDRGQRSEVRGQGPRGWSTEGLECGDLSPLLLQANKLPETLRISKSESFQSGDKSPHSKTVGEERELPGWLVPAILRQWGRSLNPQELEMALPALSARMNERGKFFAEMYARWDQPVRATVALRGRFDNWPRWPYQLAELAQRSTEVPKQLASMMVRAADRLNSRWQRHRIGIDKEDARPQRGRIRGGRFMRPLQGRN